MSNKKPRSADPKKYQEQITQLEHSLKRALADFDNYRKRIEQERETTEAMAKVKVLHDVLPILDNFLRAATHLPEDMQGNNWATGVLAIYKQFNEFLKQQGLEPINPKPGAPFDPKFHEAVSHEPNDSVATDHVIETVETGYNVNGQMLRPAKVRVSSGASPNS